MNRSYRDTCQTWRSARSHFGFNFLQIDLLVLSQVLEELVVVVNAQLLLPETKETNESVNAV